MGYGGDGRWMVGRRWVVRLGENVHSGSKRASERAKGLLNTKRYQGLPTAAGLVHQKATTINFSNRVEPARRIE